MTSATTIDTSTITSVAEAEDTFQKLAETFTDLLAKFTPLHPGGLMIGSFLNMMVMGWPIIAFRGDPDMEELEMRTSVTTTQLVTLCTRPGSLSAGSHLLCLSWMDLLLLLLEPVNSMEVKEETGAGTSGSWSWNLELGSVPLSSTHGPGVPSKPISLSNTFRWLTIS